MVSFASHFNNDVLTQRLVHIGGRGSIVTVRRPMEVWNNEHQWHPARTELSESMSTQFSEHLGIRTLKKLYLWVRCLQRGQIRIRALHQKTRPFILLFLDLSLSVSNRNPFLAQSKKLGYKGNCDFIPIDCDHKSPLRYNSSQLLHNCEFISFKWIGLEQLQL